VRPVQEMRVIISSNYDEMSSAAARIIAALVKSKSNVVLGLATGSTPLGTYKELIRMHKEGLDFSRASTFNLDEYLGLSPEHPQSYHYFMNEHLFKQINVSRSNIHIPDGLATDIEASCANYEELIVRAGGIDLQILGIGRDGHIGFNEPGSSLGSRTRLKTLTPETVRDNARFFKTLEEVPRFAITMGVGTILEARQILLLASGGDKAEAITAAIEGPVTSEVTASAVQLHRKSAAILDEEAASSLKRKDYYKYVESMRNRFGQAEI
jgi:glucosamine-6-phosphate deaminase